MSIEGKSFSPDTSHPGDTAHSTGTAHPAGTSETTLPILGMTCMGCAASVQLALSDLPGVHEATVDLHAGQARVIYDPSRVEPGQMAEAVGEAGYQVARSGYQVARSGYQVARSGYLVARSGYQVDHEEPAAARQSLARGETPHPWRCPVPFGLLGGAGLLILYLGLVSLAQGWEHAIELLAEDAWIVGPILAGFGVQVGLYTYLKTVIHAVGRGTGALAGAGGGTSTVSMVACCAHHVTDVLPLVGLSAAATFLAEYRIPFMLVGLGTNLIGIAVIGVLIVRERRRLAACALNNQGSARPGGRAGGDGDSRVRESGNQGLRTRGIGRQFSGPNS
jgi:copper chaperone CopZ